MSFPNVPETYVHRIGRTGRAGREGVAFSFCDAEEVPLLKDIQKLIGKEVPIAGGHMYETKEVKAAVAEKKERSSKSRNAVICSEANVTVVTGVTRSVPPILLSNLSCCIVTTYSVSPFHSIGTVVPRRWHPVRHLSIQTVRFSELFGAITLYFLLK